MPKIREKKKPNSRKQFEVIPWNVKDIVVSANEELEASLTIESQQLNQKSSPHTYTGVVFIPVPHGNTPTTIPKSFETQSLNSVDNNFVRGKILNASSLDRTKEGHKFILESPIKNTDIPNIISRRGLKVANVCKNAKSSSSINKTSFCLDQINEAGLEAIENKDTHKSKAFLLKQMTFQHDNTGANLVMGRKTPSLAYTSSATRSLHPFANAELEHNKSFVLENFDHEENDDEEFVPGLGMIALFPSGRLSGHFIAYDGVESAQDTDMKKMNNNNYENCSVLNNKVHNVFEDLNVGLYGSKVSLTYDVETSCEYDSDETIFRLVLVDFKSKEECEAMVTGTGGDALRLEPSTRSTLENLGILKDTDASLQQSSEPVVQVFFEAEKIYQGDEARWRAESFLPQRIWGRISPDTIVNIGPMRIRNLNRWIRTIRCRVEEDREIEGRWEGEGKDIGGEAECQKVSNNHGEKERKRARGEMGNLENDETCGQVAWTSAKTDEEEELW
eukprot:CAMPEP_0175047476 /NCGR_PEP_ID=MMETSP0052_2-20121109/5616_1 /TAXON_ID=51329 ORGANISM="Polytomella parva, Strain SAG 63-3" /NCGR_SAMPLE_ID=MMETSP0052_2 /ASSEMBLY_ACC=CAM_ASM_000194 /LENGTH=503 /DNA_ID=CAMNT_0016311355 /DNA_START=105 /DNA_END=1616 /DNA_ORIENTATION=+